MPPRSPRVLLTRAAPRDPRGGRARPPSACEGADAFRGAPAGRAVVTRPGGAEVAGGAGAVAAAGHVVEGGGAGRLVGVLGRVVAAARGAREGVDRGDERG